MLNPIAPFLNYRRLSFRDAGLIADSGLPQIFSDYIEFYHFTHESLIPQIKAEGLRAFRSRNCRDMPEEFKGKYVLEGFLENSPNWLANSPYFNDMGLRLVTEHIGKIPLKVRLPVSFKSKCYVADYAHMMDIRHFHECGNFSLGFEYSRKNPNDIHLAYLNSYIEIDKYNGGHICPVFQVLVDTPSVVTNQIEFLETYC